MEAFLALPWQPANKRQCKKGRPGVARKLAGNPDATRRFYAERCGCDAAPGEAGQELAKEYDHIDIPPIDAMLSVAGNEVRTPRSAICIPTSTIAARRVSESAAEATIEIGDLVEATCIGDVDDFHLSVAALDQHLPGLL